MMTGNNTKMVAAVAVAALVVLAACGGVAEAGHARTWRGRMGRRHTHVQREELLAASGVEMVEEALPEAKFFTQTVDHFDGTNTDTYQQRYYVNDSFYDPSDPNFPVFVYVEGEGAASARDVVYGHTTEMAQRFGALLVALEHRYYGASVPVPDLTTPNMRFLSSQQAIADLSTFLAFVRETYNAPVSEHAYITFGGSYPGALSAWARIKLPHAVSASVSTSGPVEADLNFEMYNEVDAASIGNPVVGGSQQCLDIVNAAFEGVTSLLATQEGRANLTQLFNPCTDLNAANITDDDIGVFVGDLSGIFQETIQYNAEIPGQMDIKTICTALIAKEWSGPVAALAALSSQANQGSCVSVSYADELAEMQNTVVDKSATGVGDRQWIWQTCTQFAYYQTCDANTTCPYHTNTQSLPIQLALCKTLFGIEADEVANRVDFSNDYYGGNKPDGSNILFVNGNIDPWHALSVLKPVANTSMDAIVIDGGAHCSNMMSSLPTDPPALQKARQYIEARVAEFTKIRII